MAPSRIQVQGFPDPPCNLLTFLTILTPLSRTFRFLMQNLGLSRTCRKYHFHPSPSQRFSSIPPWRPLRPLRDTASSNPPPWNQRGASEINHNLGAIGVEGRWFRLAGTRARATLPAFTCCPRRSGARERLPEFSRRAGKSPDSHPRVPWCRVARRVRWASLS